MLVDSSFFGARVGKGGLVSRAWCTGEDGHIYKYFEGEICRRPTSFFSSTHFFQYQEKTPPAAGMYVAPLQGEACTHHTYLSPGVSGYFLSFCFFSVDLSVYLL